MYNRPLLRTAQVLLALVPTVAAAQLIPIPGGGEVLRERERPDPALQAPSKPAPRIIEEQRPVVAPTDTTRVEVKGFRVTGASLFGADELGGLLTEWIGRELTLGQLHEAAARITAHYRSHGYLLSRAYLPAQEVRDGVVEVAVLEGSIGKTEVANESRMSDAQVRDYLAPASGPGAISGSKLERSLLLLNDLPGVDSATATLEPGQSVGQTDVTVNVKPSPLVSGSVDADNQGNPYTGRNRVGTSFFLDSPLGLADRLSLRLQTSDEQTRYGRLAYQLPLGSQGWQAGVAFDASNYRVGREFAALDAHGDTHTVGAYTSYPFIRSSDLRLDGTFGADRRKLEDHTVVTDEETVVRRAYLGLSSQVRTEGDQLYNAGAQLVAGDVDIRSPGKLAIDEVSARTNGRFNKLNFTGDGLFPLGGGWSAYAQASGQLASKNLDSSEKFSLGGAFGVRAYPEGEAPGDEGLLLKGELRYALASPVLGGFVRLNGFIDHGEIRTNNNPFIAAADNRRSLSAFGLGLDWALPGRALVRASVAHRLGNERSTVDTRDDKTRLWLQAVVYF